MFAHNDQLALGVREAAEALGLRVPEDLSVVGYDDSGIAGLAGIRLTSVDLDAHALGGRRGGRGARAAGRSLRPSHGPVQRPGPPMDLCSAPRLVVRTSTAPPPQPQR